MELTHINQRGEAHMVDVSNKDVTQRLAVACGEIRFTPQVFSKIFHGEIKKGDVLGVARLAGIMGMKKTPDLIPLCHPLMIRGGEVEFFPDEETSTIRVEARVKVNGETGVEMEALTGVSVALLTIYDMCKAADRSMEIGGIRLLEKKGGRSGHWRSK